MAASALLPPTPSLAQEIPALAFLYPFEAENNYVRSAVCSPSSARGAGDAHATRLDMLTHTQLRGAVLTRILCACVVML